MIRFCSQRTVLQTFSKPRNESLANQSMVICCKNKTKQTYEMEKNPLTYELFEHKNNYLNNIFFTHPSVEGHLGYL